MTLGGATALSEGEKTAISDLLKEWPFLGNLSPPWTSNSSEACIAPFKGIVCSDDFDQHIISLYDTSVLFASFLSLRAARHIIN